MYSTILSLLFLAGAFVPTPVKAQEQVPPPVTFVAPEEPVTLPKAQTVEERVREYYADAPVLIAISGCESQFRQFVGEHVLRGRVNPGDVGVMQINEYYHGKDAQSLGFDIYTLDGNLAFGRYLFEQEGTKPWSASRACWAAQ